MKQINKRRGDSLSDTHVRVFLSFFTDVFVSLRNLYFASWSDSVRERWYQSERSVLPLPREY
jgi:hypothetical protein